MKKWYVLFILLFTGFSYLSMAQDSVVIKEEGAQEDLDREKDVSELSFRERLHFGGGIPGLSFGTYTSVGLSPMAGYQLSNNTIVGLGITYQYFSYKDPFYGTKSSSSLFGENIFIRHHLPFLKDLVGQGFLVAKAENFRNFAANSNFSYSNPILLGIGLGSKFGFNLSVMYDFNYTDNYFTKSPYGSPIVFEISGFFF
ncbi:MAG: hypothetical protein RJA76_135 [Bacteroidota bacterium]